MIRSENWWEEWCEAQVGGCHNPSEPNFASIYLRAPLTTVTPQFCLHYLCLPFQNLSQRGKMLFLSLQQKCFRNTFVQKSKSIVCTVAKTSSSPWIVIERWRCKLISFKSISYFYVSAECFLFFEFVLWVALLYSFLQSVGPDWLMEASACGY